MGTDKHSIAYQAYCPLVVGHVGRHSCPDIVGLRQVGFLLYTTVVLLHTCFELQKLSYNLSPEYLD